MACHTSVISQKEKLDLRKPILKRCTTELELKNF